MSCTTLPAAVPGTEALGEMGPTELKTVVFSVAVSGHAPLRVSLDGVSSSVETLSSVRSHLSDRGGDFYGDGVFETTMPTTFQSSSLPSSFHQRSKLT
eukprot:2346471-Rhodomonas_salina.1